NLFNLGTIVRNGVPNTYLEWEKKAQVDFGVDMSMWKQSFDLRLNAYFAHHYDLLLDTKISAVYGSNEAYYANTAAINNMGVELAARYNVLNTKDWNWQVYANASFLNSRIADLGQMQSFIQDYDFYNGDDAQTRLKMGETPYEFWGYETAGIYATTAQAQVPTAATGKPLKTPYGGYYQGGDVIFVDQNNDGTINDKDRVALGSATPDLYGSFGTSLRYKKLTLTADFGFSLGNEAYNATRRQTESMNNFYNQSLAVMNRWQVEGQQAAMPRAAYGDPSGNALFSDRWIEDASYLKLRRLMLSYDFDKSLLRFVEGRLWIAAENMWTLTSYLGSDPEFSYSYAEALRGFDYAKVSQPALLRLGVNLNF
ncbi:MAG: SusC/RagA family protein, partial [Bacteroidales bacterium]|nr:SusC/RagA family protein [Bacteroidales bacterium]